MMHITKKFLLLTTSALICSTQTQAASRWLNSRPHRPKDNTGPGICIYGTERLMIGERRYPPGCVRRICKLSRGIPRLQEQFCDPLPPVPPSCHIDRNPDRRYPDCCPTMKCSQSTVPANQVAQRRVISDNRRPLRPPSNVNKPLYRQQPGVHRPRNKIVPPQLNREFQKTQTMLQRPSFQSVISRIVPPQLKKDVKRTETQLAIGFAMDIPGFGQWIMGKNSNEGNQWPSQNTMISSQHSFLSPTVHANSPNQVPNVPKYKEDHITDVIYIEKQYPTPSLDHNVDTNYFVDDYWPNSDKMDKYYIDKKLKEVYQPSSAPSYLPDIDDENIAQPKIKLTPPPAYSERTTTMSSSTYGGLGEMPTSLNPNPQLSNENKYSEAYLPEIVTKVKSSPPTTVPSLSFKLTPTLPSLKLTKTDHQNILPTLHLTQTISTSQDKSIEPKIVDRKTTTKPQNIKTTTPTRYTSFRDKNDMIHWSTYPPSYYYNRPPIPKLTVTMPTTTTKSNSFISKRPKTKPSKYMDDFNSSRPKPISIHRFSTEIPNTISTLPTHTTSELLSSTNTLPQNSTEIPSSSIQTPSSTNIYTPRLTISSNNFKEATNITMTTENPLSSKKVHRTTKTKLINSNKPPKVKQTENTDKNTTNIPLTESQERTRRIKIRKALYRFRTGNPKIKRRRTTTPSTSTKVGLPKVEYTTWKHRNSNKDNEDLTSSTESLIATKFEIPTTIEPIQEQILTSTPESYETATALLDPNKQHIYDLIYSGVDPSALIIGHEGAINRKKYPANFMPGLDLDSSPSILDPQLHSLLVSRIGKSESNLEENEQIKERKKRSESINHSDVKRGKPIFYLPSKKSLEFNVTFKTDNGLIKDRNIHNVYSFSAKPDTNDKKSSHIPTEPDWSAHLTMLPEVYLDKTYFLSNKNYKAKNSEGGDDKLSKDSISSHTPNTRDPLKEIDNKNIATSSPKTVTLPDIVGSKVNEKDFNDIKDITESATEISLHPIAETKTSDDEGVIADMIIKGRENIDTELVLQEPSISYENITSEKSYDEIDFTETYKQSLINNKKYFERIIAKTVQPLTNVPLPSYGNWAEKHSLGVMAYEPLRKYVNNQELATTGHRRYRPYKNTRGTTKSPVWSRNLENTRNQNNDRNKKIRIADVLTDEIDELTIQNPLEVICDTIGETSNTKTPLKHEIDNNLDKYELMNTSEAFLDDNSNKTIEKNNLNGILIYEKESIPSIPEEALKPTKITNNNENERPLISQEIDNHFNNTNTVYKDSNNSLPQRNISGKPSLRTKLSRPQQHTHDETATARLDPNKQHIFDLIYSGVDPSALIFGHEGPTLLGQSKVTETVVEDHSKPVPAINNRRNVPSYPPTTTLPYTIIPTSDRSKRRRFINQRKRLTLDSLTVSEENKDEDVYLSELNEQNEDPDKRFPINLHSNKPNLETRISGHQQQRVKEDRESAVEIDFKLPMPILGKSKETEPIIKDNTQSNPFITSLTSLRPSRRRPIKQRIRPTHEPLHKSRENINEHSYLLESSEESLFTQRPHLKTSSSVLVMSEEIKPDLENYSKFGPFSSKYNREHMLQIPVRMQIRPFGPPRDVRADNLRFGNLGPKRFSNNHKYNSDDLSAYIPQVMTLRPWRNRQDSTQNKDNSNYPGSYISQVTTMKPMRLGQSSTRTWLASRPPSRRRLKTRRHIRDITNN